MATKLMRDTLSSLYENAQDAQDPHLGLLLQRGMTEHDENNKEAKTEHICRVCQITASDFYRHAYQRWKQATSDAMCFRHIFLKLNTRLFIGLSGDGMLETGCAISHSHGMPYIPGSSIKGVVNAHVREQFGTQGDDIREELFGAPATKAHPSGLSGLITFHDAWWVPDKDRFPLVQEIVTSHHLDYYGNEGKEPATDFDSPVPNAQVAVQGSFLFVLEGPLAWLDLAEQMLVNALNTHGVGAKTRAGYGLFETDVELQEEAAQEAVQQQEEEARLEREREELQRQEEEARRREQLSEGHRRIEDLQRTLERFNRAGAPHERQGIRSQVIEAANRLTNDDFDWTDAAERERAATALEECYDEVGWYDPGKNKKQREKQEKKRRDAIDKIHSDDS